MLYKLIGVGMILLAGGYVSVSLSHMERRRLSVLDGYISLLRYIKGQIDCYAMPVGDILATADPSLLAACLGLRTGEPTLPLALPEMISDSRLYLEPESERLLCNFSAELGHTFRAEQVSRCDYYINALGEERRRLAETAPARARMNSILTFSCALGVAILLW